MKSPRRLATQLLVAAGLAIAWQPLVAAAQTDLEQRRQRLEALSPSEKRDLIAKKERFDRLTKVEQQRLRQLDEELRQHPQAEEMQQVLQRYGQWLANLSAKERAELRELPPTERLTRIQQLRQREQDQRLSQCGLTTRDASTVFGWWEGFAEQNKQLLVATLENQEREAYERMNEDDPRRTFLLHSAVWRGLEAVLASAPQENTNRLIEQLSQEAREQLLQLEPGQQTKLLEKWIRESIRYRMRPPPASEEELLGMIPDLPPAERQRLEKLPRDELLKELREQWERQQMSRRMRFPRGFRRGFPGGRDFEGRARGEGRSNFRGPPPPPGEGPPNGFRGRDPRGDGPLGPDRESPPHPPREPLDNSPAE